jgi:hypothetical protein
MTNILVYNAMGLFDLVIVYALFAAMIEMLSKNFTAFLAVAIERYFKLKEEFLLRLAKEPDAVDVVVGRKGVH